MVDLYLALLLLFDYSLFSHAQSGSEPLQVSASNSVYDPDGPWQAVSIQLGSPAQNLDLYPGGVFQSHILTNQLCKAISTGPCGSGGLFDPQKSSSIDNKSIRWGTEDSGTTVDLTSGAILLSYSGKTSILDQLQIAGQTVANFDATLFPNLTMVYPDGNYPVQVGQLSLGPTVNQSFAEGDGKPAVNASLVPGDLAAQNVIPSSSFGLHIGIAPKLNLSLWLGGYDASRIVGPVSSQSVKTDIGSSFIINLLDIGIGVNHGGSPFSYSSTDGLLGSGSSSISSIGTSVIMNPGAPYLSLPKSTCAAIVKDLPVTYNADKALYFWNVADPLYTKIVTSPTYLSFVFRGSSKNLTINVPFKHLNLILQAPLASTPTPYFPCQPPADPSGSYSLGRAFLQAAFIGVRWAGEGKGEWYLAQAPGPETDTNPQSKPIFDSPPVGLGNDWADTWEGVWTALPTSTMPAGSGKSFNSTISVGLGETSTSASLENRSTPPRPVLSGGTIAGIAIGGVCAGLISFGIGILLFRRRKRGKPEAVRPTTEKEDDTQVPPHPPPKQWVLDEGVVRGLSTDEPIHELPAS